MKKKTSPNEHDIKYCTENNARRQNVSFFKWKYSIQWGEWITFLIDACDANIPMKWDSRFGLEY